MAITKKPEYSQKIRENSAAYTERFIFPTPYRGPVQAVVEVSKQPGEDERARVLCYPNKTANNASLDEQVALFTEVQEDVIKQWSSVDFRAASKQDLSEYVDLLERRIQSYEVLFDHARTSALIEGFEQTKRTYKKAIEAQGLLHEYSLAG